nr:microcystin synthetase-associated thioesterase [uncultured bacterium]
MSGRRLTTAPKAVHMQHGTQVAPGAAGNWFVYPRRNPTATLQLICFASAGHGPAMFRPWVALLPPHVELAIAHLPGRESRWNEPPLTRMADVADLLTAALVPGLDRPFALFGHSLGALAAFEVAQRLVSRGIVPVHVFASAHRAPQRPNRHPRVSDLPDREFAAQVNARHGGIPEAVAQNRELMELMLPSLRADYRIFEDYVYVDRPPLPCPLTAFAGRADSHVCQDDVEPWRAQTAGPFTFQVFEGGHFFINDRRSDVVATILQALPLQRA